MIKSDDIVVWGTGELALKFLARGDRKFNVRCIVDGKYTETTPSDIFEIPVIPKSEYFSSEHTSHPLFICSSFFAEICTELQLENISFEKIKIVFAGDLEIAVVAVADLEPSLDEYIACQKDCAEYYDKLAQDKNVRTFSNYETGRFEMLEHALEQAEKPGLNLEFGVFEGESIRFLASLDDRHFWGFDSFEGLPERWLPSHPEGKFDLHGQAPQGSENITFVKGWFEDTLPGFLKQNAALVSFLHMDADLYSSTIYVLDQLKDRIRDGTIIVFDQYNVFMDPTFAERKAFEKYTGEFGKRSEVICHSAFSVGIRML